MPSTIPGSTEQMFLVTVTINGTSYGKFDMVTLPTTGNKEVKYRPGGMGNLIDFPSLPQYGNIKVTKYLAPPQDWETIRSLQPLAGRALPASVTVVPLDADGNVYGNPRVFTGTFLGVEEPKVDSQSDAVAMWGVDITCTVQA